MQAPLLFALYLVGMSFNAYAAPASDLPAAEPTLAGIIGDFEAYERLEDPVTAGMEGDRAALSRLPDITPAAAARRRTALQSFRTRLAAVPTDTLSPESRLNHAFLSEIVAERLERLSFDPDRLTAVDYEGGPIVLLSYLAATTNIRDRADADAWLARLEATPKFYADTIANARRGLATGWIQPRLVVESGLEVLHAEAAQVANNDALLQPFQTLPETIPPTDRAGLQERARVLLVERIVPARREYLDFVEHDYLPRARAVLGAATLPDGRRYYAFLVRSHTTTDLTPDQIYEIGQREVTRIRARMEDVMREAHFEGSLDEFLHFLRTDPQFYASTREDLVEKASEIAKRIDGQLPRFFKTLPRLPYGIRPAPREMEAQTDTGRYYDGSPKLGVAGSFIINTGNLRARPLYELPALTLHEAVPGHHLQTALAQELEQKPWFRRNAFITAFVEGWGLYAEHLGSEMGIFRTPYERFGQLSYEIWRACRLMADTGIHWKGWSIEQARACFRDNSALAPHNIETELRRYVADPGQALAYKIGELKLKDLRDRAEKALGDRFDVRAFHDAVLLNGPLPLDLLDTNINIWITEQQSAHQ